MRNTLLLSLLLPLLAACSGAKNLLPDLSGVVPDRTKEYRKAESLPDLEVPPDLTAEAIHDELAVPDIENGVATYSTYQQRIKARREAKQAQQVTGALALSDERVMVALIPVEQLWPRLKQFWQERGFTLELEDQELGVMETGWKDDPVQLRRDKYKLFVEPGEQAGTSVLYLSHQAEERIPEGESLVWKPRAREPQLEQAMVEQLQQYFGPDRLTVGDTPPPAQPVVGAPRTATAATTGGPTESLPWREPQAEGGPPLRSEALPAGDGKYYLSVNRDFDGTWNAILKVLGERGFTIESKDRDRGIIEVLPPAGVQKEESIWDKLLFRGGPDGYKISVTGVGSKSEVVVLDEDGKWDDSEAANQILYDLNSALNGHS
ncbi:MAG: outer membrane protein assembly factor BamC [Gammaproteobacteria bacterium]|nr:MAG: outer membrane protein assembly factor BamC [Gammaproteobacteria bacterium]